MVLGLAALVVQFLAALRLWCAKDVAVQRRFTVMCTLMAALDFVFTGLALLVWKASHVYSSSQGPPSKHDNPIHSPFDSIHKTKQTIPREAFLTFCSASGCRLLPDAPGALHMTPYYSCTLVDQYTATFARLTQQHVLSFIYRGILHRQGHPGLPGARGAGLHLHGLLLRVQRRERSAAAEGESSRS